jgi:predicted Zn-dependent peptidase
MTTPANVEITTLPSGLRVATESVPGALSVAAGVWVGVGARDEAPEIAGVSHFLEHLLFKGTEQRSAQDIGRAIDRNGGDMNAFTTKEYTAFYCRLPAAKASVGWEILGDVLVRPALRDRDVESERQVILEELAMDDDSPDDVAHRLLTAAMFPNHPLGRETAGERDTVMAIAPQVVRDFHHEWYHAGNMVVVAAGPIDHNEIVAEVEKNFVGIRSGTASPQRVAPGGFTPVRIDHEDDTEQVHLCIGLRSFDRFDPDREALDVVNHVFGGGMSSRLFDEIREKRGLVYSVYSGAATYADGGSMVIYAGSQPEHAAEVEELINIELAKLVADGITDDERDIAVGYLTGAFALGLEDTGSRMSRLGGLLTTYGHYRPVDEQVARWAAVDDDAINRAIQRVFTGDRVTVAVGPIA